MRLMDEIHLEYPFMGSRGIKNELWNKSYKVGRSHIRTLMRKMGIEAIYKNPPLGTASRPYDLPLSFKRAFDYGSQYCLGSRYYLHSHGERILLSCAIMDWASRKVLSWRLSNTLDPSFCTEALEEAISRYGTPQIFNTDQGSQFTADAFIRILKTHNIRISEVVWFLSTTSDTL